MEEKLYFEISKRFIKPENLREFMDFLKHSQGEFTEEEKALLVEIPKEQIISSQNGNQLFFMPPDKWNQFFPIYPEIKVCLNPNQAIRVASTYRESNGIERYSFLKDYYWKTDSMYHSRIVKYIVEYTFNTREYHVCLEELFKTEWKE